MANRTGIVIQARMGSTRLPGKVMESINGKPMLYHVWSRCQQITGSDIIIVATTYREEDREILWWARSLGIACYTGSPDDVLDRYYNAATLHKLDNIVRITADCPMLDPKISSLVLKKYLEGNYDYVSNVRPVSTWPDGLDTECFNYAALEKAWRFAKQPSEREHVTEYLYRFPTPIRLYTVRCKKDYSNLRWTVDTEADLAYVRSIYKKLGENFGMRDVLNSGIDCTLPREIRL